VPDPAHGSAVAIENGAPSRRGTWRPDAPSPQKARGQETSVTLPLGLSFWNPNGIRCRKPSPQKARTRDAVLGRACKMQTERPQSAHGRADHHPQRP
jgi:hypothetical protein